MACLRRNRILIVATALAMASPVHAKEKPKTSGAPQVTAIDRCRAIADQAQRLACYDAAAQALVNATNSGEVAVVNRGEVRKARESLFGYDAPKIPFFSGDTSMNEERNELQSTITEVKKLYNGYYRVVIADNAIWQTADTNVSFDPPQPGQKITIVRGMLGNYWLRINGQVGVRGKRVG